MEERLGRVEESVYDNIRIEGNPIKAYTPGRGTVTEKVHTKIGKIVTFQKNRSETKKKMTQMVHRVIEFDVRDYETLAEDFKVSVDQAKTLVKTIKSCFDSQGNFSKSTFARIIPELERYERRIFGESLSSALFADWARSEFSKDCSCLYYKFIFPASLKRRLRMRAIFVITTM